MARRPGVVRRRLAPLVTYRFPGASGGRSIHAHCQGRAANFFRPAQRHPALGLGQAQAPEVFGTVQRLAFCGGIRIGSLRRGHGLRVRMSESPLRFSLRGFDASSARGSGEGLAVLCPGAVFAARCGGRGVVRSGGRRRSEGATEKALPALLQARSMSAASFA